MFHHTNMGTYGESLKRFADMDGYVPEDGDELAQFNFASGWFGDEDDEANEEAWEQHVTEAVSATAEAEKALTEWQAGN